MFDLPTLNSASKVLNYFKEFKIVTIVIVLMLLVAGVLGLMKKREIKFTTKMLVYGSLCISLSFVLSYLKIFSWPQGGSITPGSMLPIMIFASMFGVLPGIVVGIAYGMLQLIQDPYVIHWAQLFLDYPLAFGAIGMAGLFKDNLALSALVGGASRFFFSFLSGFIFFGSYAPEGMNPIIYSLAVNGLIIGTETLICSALALVPQIKSATKRIAKESI